MKCRVPVEERTEDNMNRYNGDEWCQCEACDEVFVWEDLPDEYVKTFREYHGQPNLTPEVVVEGWICPGCGHENSL